MISIRISLCSYLFILLWNLTVCTWANVDDDEQVRSRGVNVLYREHILERKLKTLIEGNKQVKYNAELQIIVYKSHIFVIGGVSSEKNMAYVTTVLQKHSGLLKYKLYIDYVDGRSDIFSSMRDSWLRIKVRLTLLKQFGWKSGHMRVIVFHQKVYLIGLRSSAQEAIKFLKPWVSEVIVISGDE